MKLRGHRWLLLVVGFCATAVLARAHPGHEGGEVTWDFSGGHLAAHPQATMVCALALVAGAWAAAWAARAGGDYLVARTVQTIAPKGSIQKKQETRKA